MIDREVEEIRSRRRELIKKKYGGSIAAFIEEAQQWQDTHKKRTVSLRLRHKKAV